MNAIRRAAATLGAGTVLLAWSLGAQAAELDGAWVAPQDACAKVYTKRSNRISFAKDADLSGSGFVIEGNRIRGRIATCTIKSRKEDGAVVHLMATCSTDIALQDVQFALKPEGNDKITRIYPGLPELDRAYFRCP